jgi:hypothetical protein
VVRAIRRYDGLEFRLSHRAVGHWFGAVSYTYSKLTGNYSGLTDTDITDGNGGRHSPNNGRAFDLPTMTYLPNGKIDDGPLSTDRPHTAKIYGYYSLRWAHMETQFGLSEIAYQGSPLSTCLPVVGTSSACQWAEGRGNFTNYTRDPATGNFVSSGVTHDARTDPLIQTDLSVHHEILVSKGHENMKLAFEAQASNLFNQRAKVGFNEIVLGSSGQLISPSRAARFSGDPQVDWAKVMSPYNYTDALNGTGAFANVQSPLTLASRYGLPTLFQPARSMRLAIRFIF